MLKNIFEWIIDFTLIVAGLLLLFASGEIITYEVCDGLADSYIEMCEDKINLPIDADVCIERTGLMEYEYTIHGNNLASVVCNGKSDSVSMGEIIYVLLED